MKNRQLRVREYLPANPSDWQRTIPAKRTLNSHVEDIHNALLLSDESETYREWLEAIYPEEAIEESLILDGAEAARMVRNYARDNGDTLVAEASLNKIRKSIEVVTGLYEQNRNQRRKRDLARP